MHGSVTAITPVSGRLQRGPWRAWSLTLLDVSCFAIYCSISVHAQRNQTKSTCFRSDLCGTWGRKTCGYPLCSGFLGFYFHPAGLALNSRGSWLAEHQSKAASQGSSCCAEHLIIPHLRISSSKTVKEGITLIETFHFKMRDYFWIYFPFVSTLMSLFYILLFPA